ncbi:chemotaxis protein [Shewanella algae]|uniref:chemotaxis protein n=1 Tax=Shewanella algae TaxID=38313 RepID=UPI0022316B26|nr:chemotaxis protein [Shewanella algae]UZD57028.1 chemotaxis protein [Shewanella algae]
MGSERQPTRQFYVRAAIIAAELEKTQGHCKEINIIASNAQAASIRAGSMALGFKALTHSIDELAHFTTHSATRINHLAQTISRLTSEQTRVRKAMLQFARAREKARKARYGDSIMPALEKNSQHFTALEQQCKRLSLDIELQLEELCQQLKTAKVLASLCRIEACRIKPADQATFNHVANRVDAAAGAIRTQVDKAIQLLEQ